MDFRTGLVLSAFLKHYLRSLFSFYVRLISKFLNLTFHKSNICVCILLSVFIVFRSRRVTIHFNFSAFVETVICEHSGKYKLDYFETDSLVYSILSWGALCNQYVINVYVFPSTRQRHGRISSRQQPLRVALGLRAAPSRSYVLTCREPCCLCRVGPRGRA